MEKREVNWLKCIEDIKAEIEVEYNRAVLNHDIRCEGELKEYYGGLSEGYNSALKIIDRHVDKLRFPDERRYCDRCGTILTKENNKCGYNICDNCNKYLEVYFRGER